MTESEGVIQYRLDYRPGDLPAAVDLQPLFDAFARCRVRGLIGQDPARYEGLAFGNISLRAPSGFVISGTQTGGRSALRADDLAWVEAFNADGNRLSASGPARPSSEAMTHGQIYRELPAVNAVIHVHSPLIWQHARTLDLPVTADSAGYGTPAMAREMRRLLRAPGHGDQGLIAMGGHEDGVVAFAADMGGAEELLFAALTDAARLHATTAT